MAKSFTKSDIEHKAERWAAHTKKIEQLEAEKQKEMDPIIKRHAAQMQPVLDKYEKPIDDLQEKADALEEEITTWLNSQKKSVRVESKKAIAEIVRGKKLGDRVVDAAKFMQLAAKRKISGYMRLVRVAIKDAESVLGKEDMALVCDRPQVESVVVNLELK